MSTSYSVHCTAHEPAMLTMTAYECVTDHEPDTLTMAKLFCALSIRIRIAPGDLVDNADLMLPIWMFPRLKRAVEAFNAAMTPQAEEPTKAEEPAP